MNEFSCRAVIGLVEMAGAGGVPSGLLLGGHRHTPEHLMNPRNRADWSVAMEILRRVREAAGSREAFLEIFQRYGQAPAHGYLGKIASATFDPIDFFRYPNKVVLRLNTGDAVRYSWKKGGPREVECFYETKADCPATEDFWTVNTVSQSKLPALLGLPDAVVKLEQWDAHHAAYRVFAPPSGTLWARIGRFLRLHALSGDPVFGMMSIQHEDLRRSYEELGRAERELLHVSDKEREEFARSVHDGLGQELFALKLLADAASGEADGSLKEKLDHLGMMAGRVQEMARTMAHSYDPILGAGGRFSDAVRLLIQRHPGEFNLDGLQDVPTTAVRATNLYRIVQEALANAAKHGNAKYFRIAIEPGSPRWRLVVEDDGRGFLSGNPNRGMGLRSMSCRAALLGGKLHFEPLASGTRLVCEFQPGENTE